MTQVTTVDAKTLAVDIPLSGVLGSASTDLILLPDLRNKLYKLTFSQDQPGNTVDLSYAKLGEPGCTQRDSFRVRCLSSLLYFFFRNWRLFFTQADPEIVIEPFCPRSGEHILMERVSTASDNVGYTLTLYELPTTTISETYSGAWTIRWIMGKWLMDV